MYKKLLSVLIILSSFLIFSACGSGGDPAPHDATITFTPAEIEVTHGGGSDRVRVEFFHIVVKNAIGIPLNDVDLRISYFLAVPAISAPVQLYDSDNNAVNSPMDVRTDDEGAYRLHITFSIGGTLEYSGTIRVTSGAVAGSASFGVKLNTGA